MAGKSVIVNEAAVAAVASSSGKELQNEVDRLADSLSNLNPNAKEFIPVMSGKELQNEVDRLADSLSNLNPNAKEFIPVVSGKELQNEVDRLADSLSNLNPNAKEFIPVVTQQIPPDAPSFRDGSSSSSRPNHRRNSAILDQSKIKRTIFIPELSEIVTARDLAKFFEFCGMIKECRICGDTKSSLRLAFIEFSNESEARMALSLTGRPMFGYPNEDVLKILPSKTPIVPLNRKFLPRSNNEKERADRTIYCTNIDKKIHETRLIDFFEQFCGEITEFRLLYDQKHSTCIAFVEFAQWETANSALRYSGTLMGDLPIRISPSKTAVNPVSRRRW